MVSPSQALKAVLWKNLILTKRQWKWVLLEMMIPILFFGILSYGTTHLFHKSEFINTTSMPRNIMDMETLKSFLPVNGQWEILHAPTEKIHEEIVKSVKTELGLEIENVLNFESNRELFAYAKLHSQNKDLYAVTFENQMYKSPSYNLSINKNYLEWKTHQLFRSGTGKSKYNPYLHEGYLALQILINKAIIKKILKIDTISNINITVEEIPRIQDQGITEKKDFFLNILPLSLIFCFGIPVLMSIQKRMWNDESFGLNDLMTISGVPIWVILLGWYIQATVLTLPPIAVSTWFLKMDYWDNSTSSISNCNWVFLFWFLLLYNIAAISDYLFISYASRKSSIGYFLLSLLWLLLYFLPNVILPVERWNIFWKIGLSICSSNIALKFGCITMAKLDIPETLHGVLNLNDQDEINMQYVFAIFLFKIILTFFSSRLITFLHKLDRQMVTNFFRTIMRCLPGNHLCTLNKSPEESEPLKNNQEGEPFLTLNDLIKKYGIHTVLKIPRLDLYENEITAILGTNGAGKSTLISIITGIIDSYSGSIKFNNNIERPKIGFCPQKNVFFPCLTVEENLLFFAKLGDNEGTSPGQSVIEILEELDLPKGKEYEAIRLSTGLRRKLCLGMALVGNPKILVLDEPTGGVVTESSHQTIRDVLEKRSKNMTVLITTHNWREVEVISDKILILHKGEILESPKPLQNLKKDNEYFINILISDLSKIEEIEMCIKTNFPTLRILQRIGKRLILHSPNNEIAAHTRMEQLKGFKDELHIQTISYNFGILGSLFIRAINEKTGEQNEGTTRNLSKMKSVYLPNLSSLYQKRDYGYKTSILIKKLFFFSKKFYWYIPGFLILALFISLALISTSDGRHYYKYNENPIDFTENLYKNTKIFISGLKNVNSAGINTVVKSDVVEAICDEITNGFLHPDETNIIGADYKMDTNGDILGVNIVYSSSALHSAPVAVNFFMNKMIEILSNRTFFKIKTNNVPFQRQYSHFIIKELTADGILLWSILIPLGLLFCLGNYIIYANIENATQFLRLQATSFNRIVWYWNFNLLFDLISAIFKIVLILLYVLFLDNVLCSDAILKGQEYLILFVVFVVYITCQLPFSYIFASWTYMDIAYGQYIRFGILLGMLPMLLHTIVMSDYLMSSTFCSILKSIPYLLFPQFALSCNLYNVARKFWDNHNWDHMNPLEKQYVCRNWNANPCCLADSTECYLHRSYYRNEQFRLQYDFLYSIITLLIWQCSIIILSYVNEAGFKNLMFSDRGNNRIGSDIELLDDSSQNLLLNQFYLKSDKLEFYGSNKKINTKIQFMPNKLYGIHGANGTGKSLLLSILSKEHLSFSGEIYLVNVNQPNEKISIKYGPYIKKVGYIPSKSNNLNHRLSARQLLIIASLSRGYNLEKSFKAADLILEAFALTQLANTKCSELSGGNGKILRICTAFSGLPDFVLIDDAARNLDLSVKKSLWDFCLAFRESTRKTVIMSLARRERYTSLCDGFVELDNEDKIQKQSSSQRKSYRLTFRMKAIPQGSEFKNDLKKCIGIIKDYFKDAIVTSDDCCRFFKIEVPAVIGVNVEEVFEKAEYLKQQYAAVIEDYSIVVDL